MPLLFKVDPEQNGAYVMSNVRQGTLKMSDKIIIVENRNGLDTRVNVSNWKKFTFNFSYHDGEDDIHVDIQANSLREAVEDFLEEKGWMPAEIDINDVVNVASINTTIH